MTLPNVLSQNQMVGSPAALPKSRRGQESLPARSGESAGPCHRSAATEGANFRGPLPGKVSLCGVTEETGGPGPITALSMWRYRHQQPALLADPIPPPGKVRRGRLPFMWCSRHLRRRRAGGRCALIRRESDLNHWESPIAWCAVIGTPDGIAGERRCVTRRCETRSMYSVWRWRGVDPRLHDPDTAQPRSRAC